MAVTALVQVDLACRNPEAVASWYARLLDRPCRSLAPGLFMIQLDGVQFHFPPRADAGVAESAEGIHQLQIQTDQTLETLQERCRAREIAFELVAFGGPGQDLCAWDPEKNPVLLKPKQA